MARKIALQLYTLRETMKTDFLGTLKEVANIGYAGVEMAGFGGHAAPELRKIMDGLGLTVVSGHVPIDAVATGLSQTLDDYTALGAKYVGVPWIGDAYRNADGLQKAADLMRNAAAQAAARDITFFYHNHNFEFENRIGDQLMLDALFAATGPSVKWESDVYWVQKAGYDPVTWINNYRGRVPLVHIKDMTADASRTFECIGDGTVDFPAVFAAGDACGVDWYVVEQDQCPKGEVASARRSYENIVRRGWL